jgi:formamidopyrimidine-DNA glycosylase
MPELPEVETMRRDLQRLVGQATICRVDVRDPKVIYGGARAFAKGLAGRRIEAYKRRGKVLIVHLDGGLRLLVHPRMTGRFFARTADQPLPPHARVVLHLAEGQCVIFDDMRRFGRLELTDAASQDSAKLLCLIGPDALHCDPQRLYEAMQRRSIPVKVLLLDQRVMAGIGNIYASEILFACGLDPRTPCHAIKRAEAVAIAQETERILAASIFARGTTISDYRRPDGGKGKFKQALQVYGREGEPCLRPGCPGHIHKTVLAARSTYFCSHCQRTGRTRK